jgi:uncharacterized protein RhaS with RHS repeats
MNKLSWHPYPMAKASNLVALQRQLDVRLWALALLVLLSATNLASAYYDSSAQKWITRDPVERTAQKNAYAYVGNAPAQRVDPIGLSWLSTCVAWACVDANSVGQRDSLTDAGIDWRDDFGGGNACLHCVTACDISNACGKNGERVWDSRANASNPTSSNRQDLGNNHVGYAEARKPGSCWDNCMDVWMAGRLYCEGARRMCPAPARRMPPRPRPGAPR